MLRYILALDVSALSFKFFCRAYLDGKYSIPRNHTFEVSSWEGLKFMHPDILDNSEFMRKHQNQPMEKHVIRLSLSLIALLLLQCKSTFYMKQASRLIVGIWAENEHEHAAFIISEEEITYFDTEYPHQYKLGSNKTLTILDANKIVMKFKLVKLTPDSLVIQSKNDGNRNLYYRYHRR